MACFDLKFESFILNGRFSAKVFLVSGWHSYEEPIDTKWNVENWLELGGDAMVAAAVVLVAVVTTSLLFFLPCLGCVSLLVASLSRGTRYGRQGSARDRNKSWMLRAIAPQLLWQLCTKRKQEWEGKNNRDTNAAVIAKYQPRTSAEVQSKGKSREEASWPRIADAQVDTPAALEPPVLAKCSDKNVHAYLSKLGIAIGSETLWSSLSHCSYKIALDRQFRLLSCLGSCVLRIRYCLN